MYSASFCFSASSCVLYAASSCKRHNCARGPPSSAKPLSLHSRATSSAERVDVAASFSAAIISNAACRRNVASRPKMNSSLKRNHLLHAAKTFITRALRASAVIRPSMFRRDELSASNISGSLAWMRVLYMVAFLTWADPLLYRMSETKYTRATFNGKGVSAMVRDSTRVSTTSAAISVFSIANIMASHIDDRDSFRTRSMSMKGSSSSS
mmetsp:Transcript_10347/g.38144  ORF Transcript_10347/g.38144 Transcript_10347/m.38144 type:complete len:210 (-) Transcript_10347:1681-2310(-)